MINVTKASMPGYEEYCNEIKELWNNHWLTNNGEKHKTLQNMLIEYLECPNVVLFTNGHLALESMISVFDFPKGSEIITTPYTFASTTHAIVRTGMTPVFCDVDPISFCIDVKKIESLITEKTVAILPVHVYGNLCDIETIDEIAEKHNLKVLYDAAHAFGVKYNGKSVANYGDISMFSFHATKVFNTIEGGALCFHDNNLVTKLNDMKNFGIHGPESVVFSGGNAKMNEFQAAMGICNLRHFEEEIKKRKKVYNYYKERLGNVDDLQIITDQNNVQTNYAYFPIIVNSDKMNRNELDKCLLKNDILARKYFYPITSEFECYKECFADQVGKTPIAKNISDKVLTLPLYADLSIEDAKRVCDIIIEKLCN